MKMFLIGLLVGCLLAFAIMFIGVLIIGHEIEKEEEEQKNYPDE